MCALETKLGNLAREPIDLDADGVDDQVYDIQFLSTELPENPTSVTVAPAATSESLQSTNQQTPAQGNTESSGNSGA
jgi:hypothetical protein